MTNKPDTEEDVTIGDYFMCIAMLLVILVSLCAFSYWLGRVSKKPEYHMYQVYVSEGKVKECTDMGGTFVAKDKWSGFNWTCTLPSRVIVY